LVCSQTETYTLRAIPAFAMDAVVVVVVVVVVVYLYSASRSASNALIV